MLVPLTAPAADVAVASSLATSAAAALDWGALGRRAVGGGASGAAAGVVQVLGLMWLRTAMNYEYSYGGNGTVATVRALYAEGGVARLYRGLPFALVQSPLARFGDAAANAAVPLAVAAVASDHGYAAPLAATQACASLAAAAFRVVIFPVDTYKTALQVDGSTAALRARVRDRGASTLWRGALVAAAATFVGNYPWFLTYNALDGALPAPLYEGPAASLARRALCGSAASCVSDVASNSVRVVKTTLQTTADPDATPLDAARAVFDADGAAGLFGRGLQTRLAVNCLQGALFSVAWKYFEQRLLDM